MFNENGDVQDHDNCRYHVKNLHKDPAAVKKWLTGQTEKRKKEAKEAEEFIKKQKLLEQASGSGHDGSNSDGSN